MMRFILPIILIGISVTVFFVFANPMYSDITQLRTKVVSYNEALSNSKALENERDILTAKKNSMSPFDLIKLQKLLPDSIENIRLILEIEKMASPYCMVLKNVKYNATDTKSATTSSTEGIQGGRAIQPLYGVWDLEFSTTGTYNNFLNFLKDLESNLRIVDISSIQFSSDSISTGSNTSLNTPSAETYRYDFKIKTYWLKN